MSSAETLLLDGGTEPVSTTRIAEHAGIAIGTLYQYFPNMDAISAELTLRLAESFADSLTDALATTELHRKRDAAIVALDAFVDFYRSHRLLHVLRAAENTERLATTTRLIFDVVAETLVARGLVDRSDPVAIIDLEVGWAVTHALVPLAFRLDPNGDPLVLAHLRRVFGLELINPPRDADD